MAKITSDTKKYLYFDSAELITVRKQVSAKMIAEHRADYYACTLAGNEKYSQEWQKEYEYSLDNLDELTDWFWNSMDMVDVEIQTVENSEVRRDHHLDDRQESFNRY